MRVYSLPHVGRGLAGGMGGAGSARHEWVLTTPEQHSCPGRQRRPHRAYCPSCHSSSSPGPPNSTMSCWAERSSAEARPLPPFPRLRARRRRSWRTMTMTKCARASSGSVATSSFHSVRDNRSTSTLMLLRKRASSLSDDGDWCLISCLGFCFGVGRGSDSAGVEAGAPKKSACRRSAFGLRATFWPFPPGWAKVALQVRWLYLVKDGYVGPDAAQPGNLADQSRMTGVGRNRTGCFGISEGGKRPFAAGVWPAAPDSKLTFI